MLKKVKKGEPGYFTYRKKQTGLAMFCGYLMVIFSFFFGLYAYADRRNLFTVIAIILMLPTAKMTVQFLMYPRKGKATKEQYDSLKEKFPNINILCDLLITPEKKYIELTYTAITKENIIIYCQDKKLDLGFHSDFIKKFMNASDCKVNVSFYQDYNKFVNRLNNIFVNTQKDGLVDDNKRVDEIIHNFMIMSI